MRLLVGGRLGQAGSISLMLARSQGFLLIFFSRQQGPRVLAERVSTPPSIGNRAYKKTCDSLSRPGASPGTCPSSSSNAWRWTRLHVWYFYCV